MKTCNSCGGSFDGNLPKCPYCGTLNEEGAEREYKKKLYNIRKELDHVDELAVDNYKNEVRLFFKVFLITAAVIGALSLLFWHTTSKETPDTFGFKRAEMDTALVEVRAAHDEVLKLEELFNEGKYDEMCESFSLSPQRGRLYSWRRYTFVNCYTRVADGFESLEKITEDANYYRYQSLIYDYCTAVHNYNRETGDLMTPEEKGIVEPKLMELRGAIMDKTGLTGQELDNVISEATKEGYVDSMILSEFAKERWGKDE